MSECSYCSGLENNRLISDDVVTALITNGILLLSDFEGGTDHVEINYCPMCGRKLVENED